MRFIAKTGVHAHSRRRGADDGDRQTPADAVTDRSSDQALPESLGVLLARRSSLTADGH
jgi:hypothetical protein